MQDNYKPEAHRQELPADVHFVERVDYDRRDARSARLAVIGISTALIIVGFVVGIYWLFTVTYDQVEHERVAVPSSRDLAMVREREDEQLHKYGYIDKEKGVVRLSVERAMQLVEQDAAAGKTSWATRKYEAKPEPPGGARGMSWTPDGQGKAAPASTAGTVSTNATPVQK